MLYLEGKALKEINLKRFREKHRLTADYCAEYMLVTLKTWDKWENHGVIPLAKNLAMLKQFLREYGEEPQ